MWRMYTGYSRLLLARRVYSPRGDMVKTAKDKATEEKFKSVAERITVLAVRYNHKYVNDRPSGNPVYARIDYARWIADCECGGAEYVDPEEPIFFCMACGNKATSGRARKVEFPKDRVNIENETMNKPEGGWQSWERGE
jgi:hypothetical protein